MRNSIGPLCGLRFGGSYTTRSVVYATAAPFILDVSPANVHVAEITDKWIAWY